MAYDTEVLPADPAWLADHRVFGRLLAPGALYGALAASAAVAEGGGAAIVDEMQLHNPLLFEDDDAGTDATPAGRKVQVLLDAAGEGAARRVQILSKGAGEDEWTLHAEAQLASGTGAQAPAGARTVDPEALKAGMSAVDVAAFYRTKAGAGIELGPSFRTLQAVWARPGEAVGEVVLPAALGGNGLDVHPLLLDGCFQVMAAARSQEGAAGRATYLPFGWERLWLAGSLPDRLICHVRMGGQPGRGRGGSRRTARGPDRRAAHP